MSLMTRRRSSRPQRRRRARTVRLFHTRYALPNFSPANFHEPWLLQRCSGAPAAAAPTLITPSSFPNPGATDWSEAASAAAGGGSRWKKAGEARHYDAAAAHQRRPCVVAWGAAAVRPRWAHTRCDVHAQSHATSRPTIPPFPLQVLRAPQRVVLPHPNSWATSTSSSRSQRPLSRVQKQRRLPHSCSSRR